MMKSPVLLVTSSCAFVLVAVSFLETSQAQRMAKAEEPDEVGLISVGTAYFPAPEDVREFEIRQGALQEPVRENEQLALSGVEYVTEGAPEGARFARQKQQR